MYVDFFQQGNTVCLEERTIIEENDCVPPGVDGDSTDYQVGNWCLSPGSNCLELKNKKSQLIGLKKQKLDVPAKFRLKAGTVYLQDVVTFTSSITYPYAIDTDTRVTLVGN